MFSSRLHLVFFAAMLAVGMQVTAVTASAQPIARGPGGPGGHGGPGGPGPLAVLLLDPTVHAALNLSAAQETQWSALQTTEQNQRTDLDARHAALETSVAAELAETTPDLVAIENAVSLDRDAMRTLVAASSAQAVALYETLNTGQQAAVIAVAQAHYARARSR